MNTMDTYKMTEYFQSGRIKRLFWDAELLKYARICVPSIMDLDQLSLIDNEYAEGSFLALLKIIAPKPSLRTLRIHQDDLSPLMPALAAAHHRFHPNMDELELVLHNQILDETAAKCLRDIVKIPRKSLIISFNAQQDDYWVILEALRHGLYDLTAASRSHPAISFRKVTLPNHEVLFTQFAPQVRTANVLTGLQLHPFRQLAGSLYTDCRVDAQFLLALVTLLGCSRLSDLEITHIEACRSLKDDYQVFDRLRQALAANTSLVRLALRSTRGLKELWQKSIFPALTVNRTLSHLEFAHVHTTAVTQSFLELLPQMHGLRHVQAPGRQTFGQMWLRCLNQMAPSDLTVEFSLGAFSSTAFEEYDIIERILRRNRLMVQAKALVVSHENDDGQCRRLLQAVADFGQCDEGLSAVFLVLRGCLSLF